jgi:hypothetical protein
MKISDFHTLKIYQIKSINDGDVLFFLLSIQITADIHKCPLYISENAAWSLMG